MAEAPLQLEPRVRAYLQFSLKMQHTSFRTGPGDREVGSVTGLKEKKDHSGLHSGFHFGPTLTLLRPVMYIMRLPPFPEGEL